MNRQTKILLWIGVALLLLAVATFAQTVNVQYNLQDFTSSPQSIQLTTLTPLAALGTNGNNILFPIPRSQLTGTNGVVTYSNVVTGYGYSLALFLDPYGQTCIGTLTNYFPTNLTGTVNAVTNLGYSPPPTFAWDFTTNTNFAVIAPGNNVTFTTNSGALFINSTGGGSGGSSLYDPSYFTTNASSQVTATNLATSNMLYSAGVATTNAYLAALVAQGTVTTNFALLVGTSSTNLTILASNTLSAITKTLQHGSQNLTNFDAHITADTLGDLTVPGSIMGGFPANTINFNGNDGGVGDSGNDLIISNNSAGSGSLAFEYDSGNINMFLPPLDGTFVINPPAFTDPARGGSVVYMQTNGSSFLYYLSGVGNPNSQEGADFIPVSLIEAFSNDEVAVIGYSNRYANIFRADGMLYTSGIWTPFTNISGLSTYAADKGDRIIVCNPSISSCAITLTNLGIFGDGQALNSSMTMTRDRIYGGAPGGPYYSTREYWIRNSGSNTANTLTFKFNDNTLITNNAGGSVFTIPNQSGVHITTTGTNAIVDWFLCSTNIPAANLTGTVPLLTALAYTNAAQNFGVNVSGYLTASNGNFLAGLTVHTNLTIASQFEANTTFNLGTVTLDDNGGGNMLRCTAQTILGSFTNVAQNAGIDAAGKITGVNFYGGGANLTTLNASQLTSGTVPGPAYPTPGTVGQYLELTGTGPETVGWGTPSGSGALYINTNNLNTSLTNYGIGVGMTLSGYGTNSQSSVTNSPSTNYFLDHTNYIGVNETNIYPLFTTIESSLGVETIWPTWTNWQGNAGSTNNGGVEVVTNQVGTNISTATLSELIQGASTNFSSALTNVMTNATQNTYTIPGTVAVTNGGNYSTVTGSGVAHDGGNYIGGSTQAGYIPIGNGATALTTTGQIFGGGVVTNGANTPSTTLSNIVSYGGIATYNTNVLMAGSATSYSGQFATIASGWTNNTGTNAVIFYNGTSGNALLWWYGGVAGATPCANNIFTDTVVASGGNFPLPNGCGVQFTSGVGITAVVVFKP